MSMAQIQPRNWEALYTQTRDEFGKKLAANKMLKAEIRSLRRKLEDANRGAENNAHALYHCSKRGHEDAEKAHKLELKLNKCRAYIAGVNPDCAEDEERDNLLNEINYL